jgi:IS6 family transposase
MHRHRSRLPAPRSSFVGFRFPPDVIVLAVRVVSAVRTVVPRRGRVAGGAGNHRRPRHDLSVGSAVHPAAHRRDSTLRHAPGDRWFVDETYLKVAGRRVYLYRAIDQFGQVIDVLVSEKRDMAATRQFFTRALEHRSSPTEVTTDRAAAYPRVLDELVPAACHITEQYANNAIEADHGRVKSRLRPMRGLKQLRCARVITTGYAFIQNIRRGHYEVGAKDEVNLRVLTAFDELALAI